MVMHYTKKMLDTFADGIYYDNVFFTTMYRPAPAGPGYVRDDGTLGAGVDVWGCLLSLCVYVLQMYCTYGAGCHE